MTHYTTQAQAAADARRCGPAPQGLTFLWQHIRKVLADPRANSDHLLIMADALRADAAMFTSTPAGNAMLNLAHLLADLAPTRATAVGDDA